MFDVNDTVLVLDTFQAVVIAVEEFGTLVQIEYQDGERTWMDTSLLTPVEV